MTRFAQRACPRRRWLAEQLATCCTASPGVAALVVKQPENILDKPLGATHIHCPTVLAITRNDGVRGLSRRFGSLFAGTFGRDVISYGNITHH